VPAERTQPDRPPPPYDPPAGYRWEAGTSDQDCLDWRVGRPGVESRRCRQTGVWTGRRVCGRPAVAELKRNHGSGTRWWAYCERHLYGRWIEDGQILYWRLTETEVPR
jgi:hypothetical protein